MKKFLLALVLAVVAVASANASSVTNKMLEAFMQLSTARQEVISGNVANVNTPGKLSQDVHMPGSYSELIKASTNNAQLNIITTSSKHIQGSKPRLKYKTVIDSNGELKPNGNNIDSTNEAKKALKNKLDFEIALKAYKESYELVKAAVGKGGR